MGKAKVPINASTPLLGETTLSPSATRVPVLSKSDKRLSRVLVVGRTISMSKNAFCPATPLKEKKSISVLPGATKVLPEKISATELMRPLMVTLGKIGALGLLVSLKRIVGSLL